MDVRDKAKDAEDRSKGRKKDIASLFQSNKTLRKKAGNLSVKQEELDIKSTGARNDYILSLASANAHQELYFKGDLQVNIIFDRHFIIHVSWVLPCCPGRVKPVTFI